MDKDKRTLWKCEACGRQCKLELDTSPIGSPHCCVVDGQKEIGWIKIIIRRNEIEF